MERVPVKQLDQYGLIQDTPPSSIKPNAWGTARNVRFKDGKVRKSEGYITIFGVPEVAPYFAQYVQTSVADYWLYCGIEKIYVVSAGVHTELTRLSGDYTGTEDSSWSGGVFNGVLFLNNGVDVPQVWTTLSTGSPLIDMPDWLANTTTQYLTSFGNFMFALAPTEGGTSYPHSYIWSHPADPGAVPSSWDYTDPTKDAGRGDLPDTTNGPLRTGLALGNEMLLYKENSVWSIRYVGGQSVFSQDVKYDTFGAVGPYAVGYADDDKTHIVITSDDVKLISSAAAAESLLDGRLRDWYQANFNKVKAYRAFVAPNYAQRETWICLPTGESEYANTAIVWSWKTQQLSLLDIPSSVVAAIGPYSASAAVSWEDADLTWNEQTATWNEGTSGFTWANIAGNWDTQTQTWDADLRVPELRRIILCSPENTRLYLMDQGSTHSGVEFSSELSRTALALAGMNKYNEPILDETSRKRFIRIRLVGAGETIEVTAGTHETEEGSITWGPSQVYTFGTTKYLPLNNTAGVFLTLRFSDSGGTAWQLRQYTIDLAVIGE